VNLTSNKVGINHNTVQVSWSAPGSSGIDKVSLYTFRGTNCASAAHSVSSLYNPSSNATRGNVTSTGTNFYAPTGQYSARVVAHAATGSATTSCFPLGQS
jgi:hypothetical protein